ncbi:MAG: squalene--hopene cyclase [Kiritimatiellae bacterium]|nr:squalene--hopene cyclase [Kiritimatiellia bacterium]
MNNLLHHLLAQRDPDGYFTSRLSDSAISTAVALTALHLADPDAYAAPIVRAQRWLLTHANADGLYGDSPESPANLTATFLAYVALSRTGAPADAIEPARRHIEAQFGGLTFPAVRKGLLAAYGKDLTFSVPLLALATAAGCFPDADSAWRAMPRFPFEAVLIPESLFKYLRLPVVSYAIPALIAIGLAQLTHSRPGFTTRLRARVRPKALRVLAEKQPEDGGFLEAAPLTGFVAICLCAAGLADHPVARLALRFLLDTQRENGAWPIDRDLRQWVTSLALAAVAPHLPEAERLRYRTLLRNHQTHALHPFTRSEPGGWAWTTHTGGVPDADDTPAALIALHALGEPASPVIQAGLHWLLHLQNRDGGFPTFCKGWGKLPFDRSCPDLTAHAYKAFALYAPALDTPLRDAVQQAMRRCVRFLERVQRPDGSFLPLWFGDQRADDKSAPVYGSAVVLEHLGGTPFPFLAKTRAYLLANQHASGGWGTAGAESETDYLIFTARCISALAPYPDAAPALQRARRFIAPYVEHPETLPPEPIGLYFAHLWYSEALYPPLFLLHAIQSK